MTPASPAPQSEHQRFRASALVLDVAPMLRAAHYLAWEAEGMALTIEPSLERVAARLTTQARFTVLLVPAFPDDYFTTFLRQWTATYAPQFSSRIVTVLPAAVGAPAGSGPQPNATPPHAIVGPDKPDTLCLTLPFQPSASEVRLAMDQLQVILQSVARASRRAERTPSPTPTNG